MFILKLSINPKSYFIYIFRKAINLLVNLIISSSHCLYNLKTKKLNGYYLFNSWDVYLLWKMLRQKNCKKLQEIKSFKMKEILC